MVDRPTHLLTRHRDSLTPRQEEILSMIARGRTNFEIAQELGMSLDGAKWHVREILAKLNVDSREDAVAEWRRRSTFGVRVRAFARALLPAKLLIPVTAGVATIGVAGAIAAGVVLIGRDDGDELHASPSQTAEATPTHDPGASPNEPLPTDGSEGYSYSPEIAYVDPDGVVWLTNADGTGKRQVLDGCTGIGSPKSGTLTGGLRWSPAGDWIACWKEDLSVRAAAIDGSASGEPFARGECIGPVSGPSFPPGAPGVACETPAGLQVRDLSGAVLVTFPTAMLGAHKWLPDGGLIAAGEPEDAHGTWKVFAPDGREIAHIKGAFIGEARQFAITSDGRKLAYPAEGGLTVLDLETGNTHAVENPAFADVDWRSGGEISWALDGTALLFHGYPVSALIDADTGQSLTAPPSLTASPLPILGRVSPDGRYVVGVFELEVNVIAIASLDDGALSRVAESGFEVQGIGMGPHFTWSGDSSSFCWTTEAAAVSAPKYCATVGDPVAVAIDKPLPFRSEELGYGDVDIIWEALSPDLELVAFTIYGPDASVPLLTIGPLIPGEYNGIASVLSEYAFAWRPDGVVRPD